MTQVERTTVAHERLSVYDARVLRELVAGRIDSAWERGASEAQRVSLARLLRLGWAQKQAGRHEPTRAVRFSLDQHPTPTPAGQSEQRTKATRGPILKLGWVEVRAATWQRPTRAPDPTSRSSAPAAPPLAEPTLAARQPHPCNGSRQTCDPKGGNRMKLQHVVADYFRDQANWRDRKADEYPDDERNMRCATGLRDLASHVESLPDDDERLLILRARGADDWAADPLPVWTPGEEGAWLGARFRFHNPDEDPDQFFTSFCEAVEVDISTMIEDSL